VPSGATCWPICALRLAIEWPLIAARSKPVSINDELNGMAEYHFFAWRGFMRLYEDVAVLRAYKRTLSRSDSS
jgi:hypothetical protein